MNGHQETLNLTPDELCSLVQGLRAQICNRLYWIMSPSHPIRQENLGDEAEVLHSMTQAYSKAMMVALNSEHVRTEFKEYFLLSENAWDIITIIDQAQNWEEIPTHKHDGPLTCPLCEELIRAF